MRSLVWATILGISLGPVTAMAQNPAPGGGAAGDTAASYASVSPVTWGAIGTGVLAATVGLAVAVNSNGNGGTTTTTTTTN